MTGYCASLRRVVAAGAAGVCLACALAFGAGGGVAAAQASAPGPGYQALDEAPGFVPGASGGSEEPSDGAPTGAGETAGGAEGGEDAGLALGALDASRAAGADGSQGGASAVGDHADGAGSTGDAGNGGSAPDGASAGDSAAAAGSGPAVGPWFARFDEAAVARAREASEAAREQHASLQAGLAGGFLAATATVCAAAGAACLIAARARRDHAATPARPAKRKASAVRTYERAGVTKRRKFDV